MTREALIELLRPVLDRLQTVDAAQPAQAEAALSSLDTDGIGAALRDASAEGWLTPKAGGGVKFGRLAKATPETHGFTIDAVDMDGPAAGPHVHPRGEFDLCFAVEGDARFDGRGDRWIVYGPGSRHTPTVSGGRMLILYFLPGGEIIFEG